MIKGVPYDAEIAFLESTGTQWIDTGVTGASEWHITAQGAATPTASNCVIATTSSGGSFWGNYGNVDYWAVGNGSSWRCSLPYTSLGSFVVTFSASSVQFTVNGETVTRSSAPNFSKAFCLFSTNGDGYGATVRVYGCKVYQNGVLVRDFIPVRVGTVGYLYDRVTRKLFGNAGTGAFTLGPDVATPVMSLHRMALAITAKSYVQNGLVAMWDGIENAGWGTHHAAASNWKNLVTTGDILLQNHYSFSFSDNMLKTTGEYGTNTQYQTVPLVAALLNTSEWTMEIVGRVAGKSIAMMSSYPWGSGGDFIFERANNSAYLNLGGLGVKIFNGTGTDASSYMTSYSLRFKSNTLYRDWRPVGGTEQSDEMSWEKPALKTSAYNIGRDCEYHAIRLYSRALTAAEIAHNYAIDVARFKLPQGGAS